MSDDYTITTWTKEEISAQLNLVTGGTSQLHIAINDDTPDKVEIINIKKSLVAKPGEWVTEVMTVENDPGYAKPLNKTEH